jgi:D-beta-D-heptose 7-phosphate kinase/D-beta-D-heptose 1-phosphate adenosyltransferase
MLNKDKFFNAIKLKKVLVIGDLMIDAYDFCFSAASRPSPEKEGTKVYLASQTVRVLGGAGNVAANLANLGVQTTLVGLCGDDGNSLDVKRMCADLGITSKIILDKSRVTTVKTRIYIDDNYHLRRDIEDSHKANADISSKIFSIVDSLISDIDAVIISDYNKGFFTEFNSQELIKKFNKYNIPIIVDFKPSNSHFFKGSTLMAPNLSEATAIIQEFSGNDPEVSIKELHSFLVAKSVW